VYWIWPVVDLMNVAITRASVAGGVLHHMLTGKTPFDGNSTRRIVAQQVSGDIVMLRAAYRDTVSAAAARLVQHMLEPDVLRRARLAVVKRSVWMTDGKPPARA